MKPVWAPPTSPTLISRVLLAKLFYGPPIGASINSNTIFAVYWTKLSLKSALGGLVELLIFFCVYYFSAAKSVALRPLNLKALEIFFEIPKICV